MKIMTLLGTRPEIIRLCLIIKKLDKICENIVAHTGQNYDVNLNNIFMNQLNVRKPDYYFGAKGSFGEQIGKILYECEQTMIKEKPDKLLILGDTNSGLGSIIAKRLSIPVYHMEAGNRCYDDRVPEEVNRKIIDHSSDVFMPYTERSRDNLLREGISTHRIYVIGNPIFEVLYHFKREIDNSNALKTFAIEPQKYFLVTLHRAENVDIDERLISFVDAFKQIFSEYKLPLICSVHPRTKSQLKKRNITLNKEDGIIAVEPLGLFDFVHLEKNALCVLTDSGTVQEECCIFKVPNITLRDVTERPETIEAGSNIITGYKSESILKAIKVAINKKCEWMPPKEYLLNNVSDTVVNILISNMF